METTIAQRIREVFQAKHFSATSFAEISGLQAVTINRQLRGTNPISYNLIEAILTNFPDVSAEWLLRGQGYMLKNEEQSAQKYNFVDLFLNNMTHSDPDELDKYQAVLTSVRELKSKSEFQ